MIENINWNLTLSFLYSQFIPQKGKSLSVFFFSLLAYFTYCILWLEAIEALTRTSHHLSVS